MKITAEFNSNEELLSFIGAFGAKGVTTLTAGTNNDLSRVKADSTAVKEDSKSEGKSTKKETPKSGSTAEAASKKNPKTNAASTDKPKENKEKAKEEAQITKEMIRAKFMELIKAGKSKEAKEITKKYGASKLPELKEEDYPAVYKEVEALL